MDKPHYKQLQQALDNAYLSAWAYIFSNWNCKEWASIPATIRTTLALPATIGICGGMLVTRQGAQGMNEFIQRMNNRSVS